MMFKKKTFGLVFVCVFFLVMGYAGIDKEKSDLEEMKAAYELSVKFFNAGDLDGYFSLIHDDVVYCLPHRGLFIEGKKALRNFYDNYHAQTESTHWENIKPKFFVNGNTGFLWGKFRQTLKLKDQTVSVAEGYDTEIFTKVNGKWLKIFEHISVPELEANK